MCDEVKREVFHVSYLPASSESVDNAIRNLMQMVGDAKTRAMTAEAKVEKLKEALACAEWATEHAECPWCGGNKHDGHKPGCAIADALE